MVEATKNNQENPCKIIPSVRAEHQRVLKCKGFANPSVSDVYWQLTAVQIHAQAGQSTAAVLGDGCQFALPIATARSSPKLALTYGMTALT